jgi:hypothetical protein
MLRIPRKKWTKVGQSAEPPAYEPVYKDVAVRRRIATVLLLGIFLTAVGSVTASILLKRRDSGGEVDRYNQATADFFRSVVDGNQIQRHQATIEEYRRLGVNATVRLQKKLTDWGIESEITMHSVAVTTYVSRSLALSLQGQRGPAKEILRTSEGGHLPLELWRDSCPNTAQWTRRVVAPVVYVHYGRLDDLAILRSNHVHLNGSIFMVRAGKASIREKNMIAQSAGSAGVIHFGYEGNAAPDTEERPGCASSNITLPYMLIDAQSARSILNTVTVSGTAVHTAGGQWQSGFILNHTLTMLYTANCSVKPFWNLMGRIQGKVCA